MISVRAVAIIYIVSIISPIFGYFPLSTYRRDVQTRAHYAAKHVGGHLVRVKWAFGRFPTSGGLYNYYKLRLKLTFPPPIHTRTCTIHVHYASMYKWHVEDLLTDCTPYLPGSLRVVNENIKLPCL